MDEPLFTEEQWRTVMRIEELSADRWFLDDCIRKPIYGPTFADGEYFVAWAANSVLRDGVFGPPEYTFSVIEGPSGLVLGACDTKADALDIAREFIDTVGREFLLVMRQRLLAAAAERAERRAAVETIQVIANAKKPRKVSKRAKAVFEASEGKCHYCGTVLTLDGKWHIEHKFPRALFGGSEQDNLVAACTPCNHAKRDKTDLEFKALLASKAA